MNSFNFRLQLKNTESSNKTKLEDSLTELRGFKFMTTMTIEFRKIASNDVTKYSTFYPISKAETIIIESDIVLFYQT